MPVLCRNPLFKRDYFYKDGGGVGGFYGWVAIPYLKGIISTQEDYPPQTNQTTTSRNPLFKRDYFYKLKERGYTLSQLARESQSLI